ncbi:Glycosyl hydrolases family 43 [Rubripirellula amarantea]|uniref:Glycosyl hydrolases family 43 n=1 Tax=Rubripirellula amarantea TaxID=2527999 RepID=A0A5C5WH17_9BACT|nr:family 43 glycosylhydrolase [Rubripirellula amarantea]TWT49395.1 Glycosyl hydrolases family 43 [Rubripirellula amarantea]
MNVQRLLLFFTACCLSWIGYADEPFFPFKIPTEKPDMPLSEAMNRAYDDYESPTYWGNELSSKFRYTPLKGLTYNGGDGTLTRRDPSKVVKANGKYYVWYTHRSTVSPPRGADDATDEIPSADWDLAEIWYATSTDGFTWEEQGVAVPRPPKPNVGWRSVSTPDVLFWKGKYYLYYQGFMEVSGKRGDDCPVSVSYADSPDGPWTATNKIVVPNGPEGAWDQYSIHDPYPLVYKGRIYLYYKSDFNGPPHPVRAQGLAIADDPLGPFEKCPLNPVLNSGHETGLFPFRGGIAALAIRHGNEHDTIQFAPDGINFKMTSTAILMPIAPGPYVPDAFTDTDDGRGITWGLCHFPWGAKSRDKAHTILGRFDCDLSQDLDDRFMKDPEYYYSPEVYFQNGLGEGSIKQRQQAAKQDLAK